uniref:Putative secreted protein n=1 Tax=Amblyomma americanum TaxID=6943 RepID=A0A0C9RWU2_AMBAM
MQSIRCYIHVLFVTFVYLPHRAARGLADRIGDTWVTVCTKYVYSPCKRGGSGPHNLLVILSALCFSHVCILPTDPTFVFENIQNIMADEDIFLCFFYQICIPLVNKHVYSLWLSLKLNCYCSLQKSFR